MPELTTLGGPIKSTYEGQPDTNAFTDSEKQKLADLPTSFDKDSVGLGNVDNTSDEDKPVSTAQAQAIASAITVFAQNLDKSDVGLANVDNTSDADKPVSLATQVALDNKISSVTSGIGGLSIDNLIAITETDYNALSDAVKNANTFIIIED